MAIIGAGNVGGLTAMRILDCGLAEVILVDTSLNTARAKCEDLRDGCYAAGRDYTVSATDDIGQIRGARVIIVTAGLARGPGMSREQLRKKNAQIIRDIAGKVKLFCPRAICIIVTNPVDIMTHLFIRVSGIDRKRVLGFGISLDASRLAGLIAKMLNRSVSQIEPVVLGRHGQGMVPMPRLTKVGGRRLCDIASKEQVEQLVRQTVSRGAEIVGLYGSGSAYFAPSAALLKMVKAILSHSGDIQGASVLLKGEFGMNDVCLGALVRLGKEGIEEIVGLELAPEELSLLRNV
ncbi:MAG: malate dehydrogenase [Candidatus Omnitrophota bacterium]